MNKIILVVLLLVLGCDDRAPQVGSKIYVTLQSVDKVAVIDLSEQEIN